MLAAVLCTTAVEAQNAYNYQKRSHYAALPVHRSSIVFLGDSITDYGDWSEWLGNPRVINRGISGDRAEWMLDRLDPIVAGQPAKLFLMIGTNDLAAGATPDAVAANICKVVDRILAESPRTKLYVQSVFPVNGEDFEGKVPKKSHWSKGERIEELNAMIERACAERGVPYIDVYASLVDERGLLDERYTNDGLHLLSDGYEVWVELLRPYVR
mgnify:FL=1